MKQIPFLTLMIALIANTAFSQTYQYEIDLQNVVKDRVKVTLVPPPVGNQSEVTFVMPAVIPGSYSRKNYGRFINKFTAFDSKGNELKVDDKNDVDFIIYEAADLAKIEYWVDDTWDDKNKKMFVFQPGGSNIEAGKNFVLNHHAFFGYFNGMQKLPFEIKVKKPKEMYGSTYLKKEVLDEEHDILKAPHYNFLVDNPAMYCVPDTLSFMVGQTKVVISVYSSTGEVTAEEMAPYVKPLGTALENFFGELPVDEYHFLMNFAGPDDKVRSGKRGLGGFGALEHSHCSFYYMWEMDDPKLMGDNMQDICAHEFLHILTPLNIHSEEIENFDFRHPKMSQHLWMYEGITEYFSWLVMMQDSIVTVEDFQEEMARKITRSAAHGWFSYTEMSKNVLDKKNQDLYMDVYSGGALLGWMLDLELLKLSNGEYSLRDLMMELAAKYGPSKPFKDDELFDEIEAMTYPEIGKFFERYIIDGRAVPYDDFLDYIGWEYHLVHKKDIFFFGHFGVEYNEEKSRYVFKNVGQNPLGILNGDEIISINATEVTKENFRELYLKTFRNYDSDAEVTMMVKRNGRTVNHRAKPWPGEMTMLNAVLESEDALEKQLELREVFLGRGK